MFRDNQGTSFWPVLTILDWQDELRMDLKTLCLFLLNGSALFNLRLSLLLDFCIGELKNIINRPVFLPSDFRFAITVIFFLVFQKFFLINCCMDLLPWLVEYTDCDGQVKSQYNDFAHNKDYHKENNNCKFLRLRWFHTVVENIIPLVTENDLKSGHHWLG